MTVLLACHPNWNRRCHAAQSTPTSKQRPLPWHTSNYLPPCDTFSPIHCPKISQVTVLKYGRQVATVAQPPKHAPVRDMACVIVQHGRIIVSREVVLTQSFRHPESQSPKKRQKKHEDIMEGVKCPPGHGDAGPEKRSENWAAKIRLGACPKNVLGHSLRT